jgi:tripartite-type tricarboxylate transporter receptor subunit TctC
MEGHGLAEDARSKKGRHDDAMRERVGAVVMLVVAVLIASRSPLPAQVAFPTRPITLVVPLPAGGTADLLCRLAAQKASEVLGKQIVIENRAGGAGGRIGTESVLRSPPDGHTLLCAPQLTYSITHLVFAKAAFDTRAMEPVSVLATYPLIVLAHPGLPADDLPQLIAYARDNPGKVTYGHQGKGNTGHLLGELLMLRGNFRMTEVPYRGSAPAINDLLAGNIDIVPDYLLANKQNIDAGRFKMLATGGEARLGNYPGVATLSETLAGVHADTWMGIAAPPGTPKETTATMSDAVAQAFALPEVRQRILALEAKPLGTSPQAMREMIRRSTEHWAPVVEAANITIE